MSLRENVSLHSLHMYGRSPVSRESVSMHHMREHGEGAKRTSQQVSLEMLRVLVGLGTVRAWPLATSIFLWNSCLDIGRRAAGSARKDTTSPLLTYNVYWFGLVRCRSWSEHVGSRLQLR